MLRVVPRWSLLVVVVTLGCGGPSPEWNVARRGTVLEIAYGSGSETPQVGALHTESGYLRLNYGSASGWGTSIVVVPSLWVSGEYHQGAPVEVEWERDGDDLVLALAGAIAGLQVTGTVRLHPPAGDGVRAEVSMVVEGTVAVDPRAGEAFKPLMLSSMHVAADVWDTQEAEVDGARYPIPAGGWIVEPPRPATSFALIGGASSWKPNAPTIAVRLDRSLAVTGWVTSSSDPNDDNVGFWAASDTVLETWSYVIDARP